MDTTDRAFYPASRPGTPAAQCAPGPSCLQHPQHPSRHAHTKEYTDEKVDPSLVPGPSNPCRAPHRHLHPQAYNTAPPSPHSPRSHCAPSVSPSISLSSSYSVSTRIASSPAYTRPRGLRIANLLKPWIPIILYAITTLGFLLAVSLWKSEVFTGLDQLSHWLRSDEYTGRAVIFALIFLTTIPPLPLYSTLIILSGYTFGPLTGAVISYFASLAGALFVFVVSRTFFRECISRWLSCTITMKRVVRAIEKRPKLLFLIRLAPYPFNVMNCLLAASPTLTLRTYTICTALSLFKLYIHTSIGGSIHSFAEYHASTAEDEERQNMLGRIYGIGGIALCVAIFIYLSWLARKAVDEELGYEPLSREETEAFLSNQEDEQEMMSELPGGRASHQWARPGSVRLESSPPLPSARFDYGGREEASIGL